MATDAQLLPPADTPPVGAPTAAPPFPSPAPPVGLPPAGAPTAAPPTLPARAAPSPPKKEWPGWAIALAVLSVIIILIALTIGVFLVVWKKFHGDDGKACHSDADCPQGTCDVSGKCTTGPPGCRSNSECPVGQLCDRTNKVCTQAPCSDQVPCPSGQVCTNGICGPPPTPACGPSKPCDVGMTCKAGTCVPALCPGGQSDCPAGLVCNQGTCGKVMAGGGKCPPGVATDPTPRGADMYLDKAHKGVTGCCMPCADGSWPYALKNPSDPHNPDAWMWFCFQDPATEVKDPLCCADAKTNAPGDPHNPGASCKLPVSPGTPPLCPSAKLCRPGS